MPDVICRPFISAERNGRTWVWQLECDHDIHIIGPFPVLVAIADGHLRQQCPPEPALRGWADALKAK